MTVLCPQGHENIEGAAFCDQCGEPLTNVAPTADNSAAPVAATVPAPSTGGEEVCPSCGTVNPAGESFCSNCGAMLGGAPASAPVAAPVDTSAPAPEEAAPVATMAPSALNARLVVEADNQEFDLSGKDNILIGREDAVSNIFPDVDLTPHGGEEGGVSRMHARIFADNGQYMIEDENSTNFTFVNRQRLAPKTPTPLHDNDEVKLGRVLLRFKTA
ncbi:MAG TPA: FHA domain-containing protein [Ktedonobacteraceae bacterium]|nr:FHA domain-containing protein [Ktedonobacteraceae bacterium]